MATYYVRKDRATDGSEGPPDESGFFYWFDGSDAAATDPNAVWTNETNTDDSDIATIGYTSTASTLGTNNYVHIEGTDAPASGGTISSVDLVLFLGAGTLTTGANVKVYDDGSELGTNHSFAEVPGEWNNSLTSPITAPGGGWTWAKVQSLEARVYTTAAALLEVAAIGILVHTTTEGESAADPFRTIDEAADAVAAGDTVYVGAGTYREQVVMDTSGSSGSEIKFIADVDGSQTGDAGLVVISAFDDSNDPQRVSCWDPDGKTFVEVYDFVMQGGTGGVVQSLNATDDNYEGVVFEGCVIVSGPDNVDGGFYIDINAATTPTSNGLTIRNCAFHGAGVRVTWDGNETADQDLKVVVDSCLFVGHGASAITWSGFNWDRSGTGTYGSGGVSITNSTFIGYGDAIGVDIGTPTTYPVDVRNCLIHAYLNALEKSTTNDGALTSDYNTVMGALSNVTAGTNDRVETSGWLLGGIADLPLYRKLGWSPYLPWEPMRPNNDADWTSLIGDADSTVAPATDLYGNPRPMSQAGTTRSVYYFDASDAGPTDEGTVWTNDANAFNGDSSDSASTSTAGTTSTNRLLGEGTNAPTTGQTISQVEARAFVSSSDGTGDAIVRVYENGGSTQLVSMSILNAGSGGSWRAWQTLAEHSGGWTWQKINDLETWMYLSSGTDLSVHAIQIRVTHVSGNNDDRGAVEGRARPEQETSTVRTGSNAIRLEGAGYHDFLVPVAAQSTTITVYAQYDGNYAGTLPSMTVTNDDIMTEVTDTQTGGSGSWEQLTSGAFTPSAAGVVKVRVTSSDTSDDGRAFFDDLVVA